MAPKVEREYSKVVEVNYVRETDLALLLHFDAINEDLWVPKSITRNFNKEEATIEIQDWWLDRNYLE